MIKRTPKSAREKTDGFSRREREIMDALYRLDKATAAQILEQIPNPPSYTAIRTLLTILEKKGHVRHRVDGPRYVYEPAVAREKKGREAIDTLLSTFYGNSVVQVVAALLEPRAIPPDELDRMMALIAKAKKEGR